MAKDTSGRHRLRPHVYVHFEFGISLGGNKPPPHHENSYRSCGFRKRSPNFPRVVPALNTNYLATAAHHGPQAHNHTRGQQADYYSSNYTVLPTQHGPFYYYGGPPVEPQRHSVRYYGGPGDYPEPEPEVVSGRSSRDSRRASHERGTSAPPPLGDNPWDIHYGAGEAPFSTMYRTEAAINPWKSLPDTPSEIRPDEEDIPWDAWSVPHSFDPTSDPDDEEVEPSSATEDTIGRPGSRKLGATNPTDLSIFSIGPTGPPYRIGDPGRVKELAGLSSAMVTVDNGFENQWWYQGGRESVATGEAMGVSPPPRFSRKSLGWAVASTSRPESGQHDTSMAADVASLPRTQSSGVKSPDMSVYSYQSLTRSLTTRSDELFVDRRARSRDGMP